VIGGIGMKDIRLRKLAHLIVNYSLELKKGETVLIRGSYIAEPLIKELYREALKVGAHPEIIANLEGIEEMFFKEANEEQLQFVSPLSRLLAEKYDALIHLWGDFNTKGLSAVNPERMALKYQARRELNEILRLREERGEFRWCGTQFPTHSDAQEAGMSLEDYAEFVFRAGMINLDDPVEEWRKISARQQRIVDYLNRKNALQIIGKDTDLKMSIAGRTWINCDGKSNFPDGEVFTAPLEDSVEGRIRFSFPGIYAGQEIEDIQLEFKEGKVIKASASKGEELLTSLLNTDEGAKRIGEIAIGTNYQIKRFTKNMLFDEKIGGTVHAALGESIAGTGGKNSSGIHWDMLCDLREEGKIYADGELFYENGQFIEEVINGKIDKG
jgi:aminopeptidase